MIHLPSCFRGTQAKRHFSRQFTVSVRFMLCMIEPDVPVTVIIY